MSSSRAEPLRARPLMRPYALVYFYRRRLRVHAPQELLAGLGVAVAVALVFATLVAGASVAGSAGEVVHAVIGPANLQLRTRATEGFEEGLLPRVERLPAVRQAAPLLEQTATIVGPHGRRLTIDLAGADTSLVTLDGLAHTIPIATIAPGGLGLSRRTAEAVGLPTRLAASGPAASSPVAVSSPAAASRAVAAEGPVVTLKLRGRAYRLHVSAVLGPETFGALSQADVAVTALTRLQRLAGLPGRISRILVQSRPGEQAAARAQLQALAGGALTVAAADQEVAALRQALAPSDQASAFFAAIAALLGLLFAFNALLLTVPERRRAIADLRLIGAKRPAIVQMVLFQALCLGLAATLVGLLGGYLLSRGVFHQSPRYLAEAFTLGTRTVVEAQPLALAFLGGILACCLASAVPLLDLRRGGTLDAVYRDPGVPGNTLGGGARRGLALAAAGLLALTTLLFALAPSLALLACAVLALATVLAVPLTFAGALRLARALAERWEHLTILPVALSSLRATTVRSLALAATGAVAIFGSVALGGGRGDLLRGIQGFAHSYAADASIWVGNPGDNQATVDFRAGRDARRIARIPGVASVRAFQGGFLDLGNRRVWVIARPPGGDRQVLESQITGGSASRAIAQLGEGGWIAVSKQIAEEHHVGVGGTLALPTPSGAARFRIAATTTNLAWSPGAIFMNTADYSRLWKSGAPTALGVEVARGVSAAAVGGANAGSTGAAAADDASPAGVSVAGVQRAIEHVLGPASGLEVTTAHEREASIDALTSEGLGQLGEISTLLVIAAILALAAALTSAIWQRRVSLAALRLSGVRANRLRLILGIESALILGAGCLTGAVAGIYGQAIIDSYLAHITGFPVASLGASFRPLEIFALVIVVVLAIVAVPGWIASRVSPILALNE
jgi:putative ABC transport system permease protein